MKKMFEKEDQGLISIETPEWERYIEPQSPEQPLFRIYRNEKESCFDALFAIELAGVDRERGHSSDNEENRNDGIFDCFGCLQKEAVEKVSRIMYTRKTKDVEDYIHARRTEYKNSTKEAI